jgi:nucleoside-diphosphate-sugar epimerase
MTGAAPIGVQPRAPMPTAFVTGGSGFIGGTLVRRLVADGVGVRALARSDASAEAVRVAGGEPVPGDLGDPSAMALGADGCDLAFHCAGRVGDWGPPAEFEAVNVAGTRHALWLVWGPGDTTILPPLVDAVRAGRFAWVGGGRHRTATTHVDNAVHGLVLAARAPEPGSVYFVTDGAPLVFRDFVTRLLATQGVEPPRRSVPRRVAQALAAVAEAAWRALPLAGRPPLTRLAVWLSGLEVTIDTTRARTELGYAPVRTVDEGRAELADEARSGEGR